MYTLTVGINRPWHMSKDFVTELNFVHHINTNQPDLWVSDPRSWRSGGVEHNQISFKNVYIPVLL